ncbi:MAG TPA: MBL fold metallo-hydrolase [Gemmatimonadaceae bacterium]|nr:MBL fold metallo-hydrolase [Gemmatimonadaceae bacterium]
MAEITAAENGVRGTGKARRGSAAWRCHHRSWQLAGLRNAIVATACGIASLARAQPPALAQPAAKGYSTVRLSEGVYAFVAPESRTSLVTGNSLVVVGSDGVLVVDSGHLPSVTRQMIREIKTLTDQPVRYLINTHWHEDHVGGNGEFRAEWPGVSIVSTTATLRAFQANVRDDVARQLRDIPPGLDQIRRMLAAGANKDGSPMSPSDRAFREAQIVDFGAFYPELSAIRFAEPTLTFESQLSLYLGGREVRILWLGPGNTAGDAVVHVPDARVVATGDLLVAPTPYASGSFMYDWPKTMRRLMQIDAVAIVPGHGPVERDWTYAALVTSLLDSLGVQVQRAVDRRASLEDTRAAVDVTAFRDRMTGTDSFRIRAFNVFFLATAIERAYREAMSRSERN